MKEFGWLGKPKIKRALILQKLYPVVIGMGWHCSDALDAGSGNSPKEAYRAWFEAKSKRLYRPFYQGARRGETIWLRGAPL